MASPTIKPVQVGEKTRYRFVVDIGTDPVTGKRKQKTYTFDRRREAQTELAKVLHEVGNVNPNWTHCDGLKRPQQARGEERSAAGFGG